ncbi:unnamed protein product [Rhizophagus irregularis]|uniref:DDE-1 domain-containing protein n=2 Tax=Rhizophagus irregularis TaxID=588596 RepID=A0A915ZWP6_9GLOM|nr:unnamed protein product [Rhizophagus irregularis]
MLTKRKGVSLSAKQKHKICEMKEKDPTLQNVELAQKYNVRKSTITDILRESDHWLTITESQENTKKFHRSKWLQLEGALGLWVDNALNTKQDIDSNILKQGEAKSAPLAESIERDRFTLQQLLASYNPEDIWNGDETGLFWKMEPSRVLACNSLSGHKKEKSCVTIFCATNATGIHLILDETQEKLDSIDVKFLSPNTTTKLQPCDVGIIHSFKCHYKCLFIQNRIDAYDNVQDGIVEEHADYTIYDSLQNAAKAWLGMLTV